MTFAHENARLRPLRALFSSLEPPAASMRHGFFRASFIGPLWLRLAARPSVTVSGLPGWQGKRFADTEVATNVLRQRGRTRETLTMRVTPGVSQVDRRRGVALHYVPNANGVPAPLPWRWVRDELRAVDDNTILCMTVVDLPVLRLLAFPFLLTREG